MLAKELIVWNDLKQAEAARLLGVNQPAISLYLRRIRGKAIDLEKDPDVTNLTVKLAVSLTSDNCSYENFITAFCEICRMIRAKGLLCEIHKTFDSSIDVGKRGLRTTTIALNWL